MPRLVALVGGNIGDLRFEPGDRIDGVLTEGQQKDFVKNKWAEWEDEKPKPKPAQKAEEE